MKSVSVSIVSYNSAEDIVRVLDSIVSATSGVSLSVYVVDNHSADDTCAVVEDRFPQVTLIKLDDNVGFGAAHNRAIAVADSEYHVIVNPDITFDTDVLTALAVYLDETPQAVLATPLILNTDGSPQAVPRVLPKRRYMFAGQLERFGGVFRRWRDEYTRRRETFEEPTAIAFCTGCFMMVRTAALKEVGGFDDRFFMYMEDADLSRRLAKYGRLMLVPQVRVTHVWEKASGKSLKFLKIHLRSMRAYFAKWRGQA
ncbi:MAG: glycosyltransferase family 2 protein [Clostridia bacterium]|nr:glycosyltransferase family 2 protein [Clostridia bacterium]